MPESVPATLLSALSSPGAVATEWVRGRQALEDAEICWLSTVRPDGRPHVTPLLGVWVNGALHFCTGSTERKAKNLAENRQCILTTGCNGLEGLDIVLEGLATRVSNKTELRSIAESFETKYGPHFEPPDGTWSGLGDAIRAGDDVQVFRVDPSTAFGFGKGEPFSQTRWGFGAEGAGRPGRAG
ncbi:MAG: pyridoxamine 5'-phosphate oxidase family protein [Acidimicrobiales bacterium]